MEGSMESFDYDKIRTHAAIDLWVAIGRESFPFESESGFDFPMSKSNWECEENCEIISSDVLRLFPHFGFFAPSRTEWERNAIAPPGLWPVGCPWLPFYRLVGLNAYDLWRYI